MNEHSPMHSSPLFKVVAAILWLSVGGAEQAYSHGVTPAAMGAAGYDEPRGPWVLKLSRGMAFRVDTDTWRYLCDERWGGPETAISSVNAKEVAWVVGTEKASRISPEGVFEAVEDTKIDTQWVLELASIDDQTFALHLNDGASFISRLTTEGSQEIWQDPRTFRSLEAYNGMLHVGLLDKGVLVRLAISMEGDVVQTWEDDLNELNDAVPSLRAARRDLFVVSRTPYRSMLWRVSTNEPPLHLHTSTMGIGGPAQANDGDHVFIIEDNTIVRITDGESTIVDASDSYTCIMDAPWGTHTCSFKALRHFDTETETLGDTLFSLMMLTGPESTDVDAALWPACQLSWLDFASDAGMDHLPEVAEYTPEDQASSTNSGCVSGTQPPPRAGWIVLCLALFLVKRLHHRAMPT